jgi:hypothetical protein
MGINAIIFGATGMVGEGVLHECLQHPDVSSVLVINRRSCNVQHEKLSEIIHPDFHDLAAIESRLSGFNACYFCMGVSSAGMSKEHYFEITHSLTLYIAGFLLDRNPDMTICYVSGAGTDSSEKGRVRWARVKGKTENDLLKMPFRKAYMFRPGYIQPTKGLKNTYKIYSFFAPFYPIWKTLFPKYVCTLEDLGRSMINVVKYSPDIQILENTDITRLAKLNVNNHEM